MPSAPRPVPGPPDEHWSRTRLPDLPTLRERLQQVFPPGLDGRAWAVAERAARSLYVFLYAFAVEGLGEHRLRPAMVTTMSDAQAANTAAEERVRWWDEARRPRRPGQPIPGRWYAENTREPIRDETFRVWKEYGALQEDPVPTTSAAPRYRLARDFADLFDPQVIGNDLVQRIDAWQKRRLTTAARARMALLHDQATASAGAPVRFPDGSMRVLSMGPSTPLLKAAIERFAPAFLHAPIVLVATESRRRLAYEDAAQLQRIRLHPDPRLMPDLLLADVGASDETFRFVFLECVATGGAMTRERIAALRKWLANNGYADAPAAFGTVFGDRGEASFRRYAGDLAWGSFAWFASEPANLLVLLESGGFEPRRTVGDLVR